MSQKYLIEKDDNFMLNAKRNLPDQNCFDESHNVNNCLTNDTKLVIIGTITPKNFDYFYCAPRNKIYGYIDEATGKTHLKDLKNQLNK